MPEAQINYFAVIAAAILNMIIGALWYSPSLFGRSWLVLIGKRMDDLRAKANKAYVYTFVGSLIAAYVLSHFVDYVKATTWKAGAQTGFWIWFGFVATSMMGEYLFAGRPKRLYLINVCYHLVSLVVMGALLAAWQ